MARCSLIALALAAPMLASAGPTLVSDPTTRTEVTHCAWYMDATPRQQVAAPKDSTGKPYCALDVAGLASGVHTVRAAFVIVDPAWGELEGPTSDPFPFSRPAPPPKPSSLRVAP